MEWHWHFQPVCIEAYGFDSRDKCYYTRSQPSMVVDIIYTHEGEQVYLSGARGAGYNSQAMKALQTQLKEQGVLWARWEHNGRQMKCNLLTGQITRDKE